MSEDKITVAKERIQLVNRLMEVKEHFQGPHLTTINGVFWDHPYRHYQGLIIYLALTCFDMLGQRDNWMDFGDWLVAADKQAERDRIISQEGSDLTNEAIAKVYSGYKAIYGVRSSFLNFIRKRLSTSNQHKLFDSIQLSKITNPTDVNESGIITTGLAQTIAEDRTKMKEDFLFDIRNNFTHNGIYTASPAAGIFPDHLTGETLMGYEPIYSKKEIVYEVRRWPTILIEILNETLEEMK